MKQIYFSILLLVYSLFISAQTNLTGNSTETGVTDGQLSVSLSGSSNYFVPIKVPPGINGVEPQIGLNYNSHKGLEGTAAAGWDISGVSSITRVPSTKFHDGIIDPVDFDGLDRFALDGQRLILKNSTDVYGGSGTIYETENFSNIKVTSYGTHPSGANFGPAYFLVEYPDGSKAYFGNSLDSRSIAEWSITNIDDLSGITISYSYTVSDNSLYIDSIKYGSQIAATPINEIKFIYKNRVMYKEDGYIGGFNIKRDKNLSEINISVNSVGYKNYIIETDNNYSLRNITEKNGDKTKSLNPTLFDYTHTLSTVSDYSVTAALNVGDIESRNTVTVTGDFNADGRMDFIIYPTFGTDAKKKYWLFTGVQTVNQNNAVEHNIGSFEEIFTCTWLSSNNKVMPNGWTIAKINPTTNVASLTTYSRDLNGTTSIQDEKQFAFPQFSYYSAHPLSCVQNRPPILNTVSIPKKFIGGDFNGDGLTDVLAIELNFSYTHLSDCEGGSQPPTVTDYYYGNTYFMNLDRRSASNHTTLAGNLHVSQNSKVFVADFDGDGKSDIYVVDTGYIKIYTLNNSNNLVLLYSNSSYDSAVSVDKPILIGDYNGDGKFELLIPKTIGGSTWCKYTSTGLSLIKEEKSYVPVVNPNDPYTSYDFISSDYNNDGKTDLIKIKSSRNVANTLGWIYLYGYTNFDGDFQSESWYSRSADSPDINIYAVPVFLTKSKSYTYGNVNYLNNYLELAFINKDKIFFFNSGFSNIQRNNLLSSVTTGSGVKETIRYVSLDPTYLMDSGDTNYPIFATSSQQADYPFLDIITDSNFPVVSKIELQSKNSFKKKLFGYYGAVTSLDGLGFIGFRAVSQTNWHDDNTKVFTSLYKSDIDLRGATIEDLTVPYLFYPYSSLSPSDFITKSSITYNSQSDVPLQSNKVFKLKTTNVKQFNALNNTSSEIKDIVYDNYNNVKSSTILSNEGTSLIQTQKTDVEYDAVANPYIIGRPLNKSQSVTADGHTMTSTEVYTYNLQHLLQNTDKSALGTSVISESNTYDTFGNIIKKTITPPFPLLARQTIYEFDTSGRFVTKIINNDNQISTYDYDLNGLLKKETDPYGLSRSYTYDSWFKNLSITDDQLNSVISSLYTKNGEKTTVSTTVSGPGLDTYTTEETFDDLGRKIKSGGKDLNGDMSYISYQYDIYDRNFKTSEPYFGSAASQWNEVKFDDYGRDTDAVLFNGRTTSVMYTPASLVSTFTDGQKSKVITGNATGSKTSVSETIGGNISFRYFANGNVKQTTYNGTNINVEQNGWGNKTKLQDSSAGTYNYIYNDLGELTSETIDGSGITTTIARDLKTGRPITKTISGSGTSSVTNYTYDGSLPVTIDYIDNSEPVASNRTLTTISYDNYKRVSTIVEEKFNVSKFSRTFSYDALGRIDTETKLAEIGGKSSSVFTKNEYKNGELHKVLDINNKVLWQANILNAKGQILESETGNGIKTVNTYNNDGYLSEIKFDKINSGGNVLTLNTLFDKNTDNLTSRTNSSFGNYTENFEYDEIDRLTKFTNRLGVEEAQSYDISGNILSNNLGTYEYDPVKKSQNTAINLSLEAEGYYYNRVGIFNESMEDRKGWLYFSGNQQSLSFDDTRKTTGKYSLKINNSSTEYEYSIPINNAVDTQYNISCGIYQNSPDAGRITVYMYEEGKSFPSLTGEAYSYNVGRWGHASRNVNIPANIRRLRIKLANDTGEDVWFDDVQIRKSIDVPPGVRTLNVTYNAFKSPSEIFESGIERVGFTYNCDNGRSTMYYGDLKLDKLERSLRKHYSADGTMEIKENRTTGLFEFVTYIGGDGYSAPIAVMSDGTTPKYLYLHRDYQGTILAVTNDSGTIVEKRLFDAWGSIIKVQDGVGNTLSGLTILDRGYTGHEHLQNLGLINMNARLYDPVIHRFLQSDNYIQDITSTQNYNQYGYVLNNPLKYIDPSGEICEGCGGAPGVDGGSGTGISTDLAEFGRDTGITDWAKKNLNFNSWGRSWNKFWGKDKRKKDPIPAPNVSKYGNIQGNNLSSLNTTVELRLPNSNGISVKQWEELPLYKRMLIDRPGVIGGTGGLGFVTVEAEALLLAKTGEKIYEVYHLVNTETQAIEYIGKTSQGILKRFEQHLLDPKKQAWINNVEPVLFKGGLSRYGAKYYEQTQILAYKLENLYNKINGVAERYWIKYGIKR